MFCFKMMIKLINVVVVYGKLFGLKREEFIYFCLLVCCVYILYFIVRFIFLYLIKKESVYKCLMLISMVCIVCI